MIVAYLIIAVLVLLGLFKGVDAVNSVSLERKAPGFISRWIGPAKAASAQTGVPLEYILSVIWVESAGNPDAVGGAGEIGLMQLKKIAADDVKQNYNIDVSGWDLDPVKNILVGSYFLALQYKRTGDWGEAFESYNQGYRGQELNPELAQDYENKVKDKIEFLEA